MYKRKILLITILVAFMAPFMGPAINIALPTIGVSFDLNTVSLNWITLSYVLSMAVFTFPLGRFCDTIGEKNVLIIGVCIYATSSFLCGISSNHIVLIIFRVLQGIGASCLFVSQLALLSNGFEKEKLGKYIGINLSATYLGVALSPFLGGILTKYIGWRSVFFFVLPICLIILVLALGLKKSKIENKHLKFDFLGFILFSYSLFGIICGFSIIKNLFLGLGLILTGAFTAVLLVHYEQKVTSPIINIKMLKENQILLFSSSTALLFYGSTFAIGFLMSLYLQYIKGYDPQYAGLILLIQPTFQAILAPVAGKLSDKYNIVKVSRIGISITLLGLISLIFIKYFSNIFIVIGCLLIIGLGLSLFTSPNTKAIMNSVEQKYHGISAGIISVSRTIGQSISMAVSSLALVAFIGNVKMSAQYNYRFLEAFKVTLGIMSIICFLSMFFCIKSGKKAPQ